MRPAKTTVIHFGSQVARSIIGFLATLYFANVLGSEPLGYYFVAVALLAWLSIPTSAIGSAIEKRVSEGDTGEHITAGFVLLIVIGAPLAVLLVVFAPTVNAYIGAPIAHLTAGLLLARIIFGAVTSSLIGQKRVEYAGLLRAGDQVIRAIVQVGLVVIGLGVVGLVLGHTIALVLASVIGLALFVVRPARPSIQDFRELLDFAKFSWLGMIRTQTFSWMDILVLNLFVVPSLIGIYEVAWKLASAFVLVNISIQQTLFPEISSLAADGNLEKIREFANEALFYSGIFTIPGLFGAAVIGPQVLELYSEEFSKGYYILIVLILARGIDVYGSIFNNILHAIDRPDIGFRINLIFAVVNVGLNFLMVYLFGWIGAAVATTISVGVVLLLGYHYVTDNIGSFPIPYRGILVQILAAGSMGVLILGIKHTIPWRNTLVTAGLVTVGVSIYGVLLLLFSRRIRKKAMSLLPEKASIV